MIIFEGMPGAGKTTRLSRLLEAAPDRVVIFPEAQPPRNISHDHDAARWLLTEDLARATGAAQINRRAPESVIISDRSYLGVLAYRRALAACGLAPSSMLKSAIAIAQELDIIGAHRSDTFVLISLTVQESLRRRSAFAADKRHRLWFDSAFLTAYANAINDLAATHLAGNVIISQRWEEAAANLAVLPEDLHSALAAPPARSGALDLLSCASRCAVPMSHIVTARGASTQLFTGAIHRQVGPGPAACLTTADHVLAEFLE